MKKIHLTLLLISTVITLHAQNKKNNAISSGIPWFDDRGKVVSAHGANIIFDKGKYYLYGEAHSDTSNAFAGFSCYSSEDLYNWKFENMALRTESTGRLDAKHVGERPKVLRCPKTGEYIMLMHSDTLGYTSPYVGYATSKTATGPYIFHGPLLYHGQPIKKWDMGSFQDTDGSGYLLIHGGLMYKLADDYKSASEMIVDNKWHGCEAPAMMKKNGIYYWLTSDLTSWEKNDNVYYTARSLRGPWTLQGNFAPKGSLTWNSQTTFVLTIPGAKDTTYIYMGDRWSYPKQASAATYIWQPLKISGSALSMPTFYQNWRIDTKTGVVTQASENSEKWNSIDKKQISYKGSWAGNLQTDSISSDEKNAKLTIKFNGTGFAFQGLLCPNGGYGRVELSNDKGQKILSTLFDTYCKYNLRTSLFKTPKLQKGNYILTITVLGEHGNWSDKAKKIYGSTGNIVTINKIIVSQ